MIIPFKIKFSVIIYLLIIVAVIVPQVSSAQRFSHPTNEGRGSVRQSAPAQQNSPAAAPATTGRGNVRQSTPAPQSHPAASPAINRPQAQPPSRTINGGSQNFGNRNVNRPTTVNPAPRPVEPKRTNAPIIENPKANEHRSTTIRENINVYHSSNIQSHPYSYHPYHPSSWGPSWHPIGFIAAKLARDAFIFSLANRQYYYDQGVYYQPVSGGYTVVSAPVGAVVSSLPDGYETVQVGDDYFYYYGGTFYIGLDQGYQVVDAPIGAIVMDIPDGATQQNINGEIYLAYNNTYYEPVSFNGQDAYQVVQFN